MSYISGNQFTANLFYVTINEIVRGIHTPILLSSVELPGRYDDSSIAYLLESEFQINNLAQFPAIASTIALLRNLSPSISIFFNFYQHVLN